MRRRSVFVLIMVFLIPYVNLLLSFISYYSETPELVGDKIGHWVFWITNVSSLLQGVCIGTWFFLMYKLPKCFKKLICMVHSICFIICIALLYTTLFKGMYMYMLENRTILFEWLGICLLYFLILCKKESSH